MDDDQAIRQQWETLLASHRDLVWACVQALGTDVAGLLSLPLESE